MLHYGSAVEILNTELQELHYVNLGKMDIKGLYRIFIKLKQLVFKHFSTKFMQEKSKPSFYISCMLTIMFLTFYISKLDAENNFIIIYRIQKNVSGKRSIRK